MSDQELSAARSPGPLAGVRVLDVTGELAALAGRLLAGLGADVVRVEPPGGDPLRTRWPLAPARDGSGAVSLAHVVHNGGKRSILLSDGAAGHEQLRRLADAADIVVLEGQSPLAAAFSPSPREWAAAHPRTSFVVVDPFPEGPFAGAPFTDLTLAAASGFAWLCGEAAGPPEHPKGQMAYAYTGAAAAVAAMAGLAGRSFSGEAGWFELTGQEAFAFATFQSNDPNQLRWHGILPKRQEWSETARRALQQCGDGKWCTFVMLGAHFKELADWFSATGVSDAFHSEAWLDREYYLEHQPELTAAIAELCRRYDRDTIVRLGQEKGLMVMPVATVLELLEDPQLRERGILVPTATPVGTLRLPRVPATLSRTPVCRPTVPVTAAAATVLADWSTPRSSPPPPPSSSRLPLEGMRVADFSWMLAGPIATRLLADLGADVIRMESHARRDMTREIGPQPPGVFSLDTNSTQHHASSNKRSIALNFNHPEAVALAREIVAKSDIVFENFTPGTMARWGLDPGALMRDRPDLIVVSQPAVGGTGPHRTWGAIGNGVAGYGGINMLTGFPHNPPFGVGPIVSDFAAPFYTVAALLAAVHYRARTGHGQYIDCGMVEATFWLLDTAFAEAQVTGANPARTGNRCAWMSPHGIFPCRGRDEWIAIAARDDGDWIRLAKELDLGVLAADARLATLEGRKRHEDLVEQAVAEATQSHDRWALAGVLIAAGVPAAPVEHIQDHLDRDSGTKRRFTPIGHPYGFEFLVQTQFIRPRGEIVPNRRAPMIGEHSDEILRGLLGRHDEEIAELIMKGVIS